MNKQIRVIILLIGFLFISSTAYAENLNLVCTYYSNITESYYTQNYIVNTSKNIIKIIGANGEISLGEDVRITDDIIHFKSTFVIQYINEKSTVKTTINRNSGLAHRLTDSNKFGISYDEGVCEKTSKKF